MDGGILIVDGNPQSATVLQHLLRQADLPESYILMESQDVLGACESMDPDLLILDPRTPSVDGFEILAQMKDLSQGPPVLVLTADTSVESRRRALSLGAKDFLSKPFDDEELVFRVKNLLDMRTLHRELRQFNRALEVTVSERSRDLYLAAQGVEMNEIELRRTREETVLRLALAAELKDDETPNHVARFSQYCEILGQGAGYDRETSSLMRLASVLHDVGKIGIPEKILMASGKLTGGERELMQTHAEIGFRILDGSGTPLLDMAASIALNHHERFDGSGYPRGLAGTDIPVEGRIAAIADVFDALTTDRVYRRRYDLVNALRIMKEGRETEFDPDLLDLFFESMDRVLKTKEEFDDN